MPCVEEFISLEKPSDSPYQSYVDNEKAPCLSWKRIAFCRDVMKLALDKFEDDKPRAEFWQSPIRGELNGVCRTFIATADCDPLRDEGEAYGHKLAASGVSTTLRRYMGVPHPFMHMLNIKQGQEYVRDICAHLRMSHDM